MVQSVMVEDAEPTIFTIKDVRERLNNALKKGDGQPMREVWDAIRKDQLDAQAKEFWLEACAKLISQVRTKSSGHHGPSQARFAALLCGVTNAPDVEGAKSPEIKETSELLQHAMDSIRIEEEVDGNEPKIRGNKNERNDKKNKSIFRNHTPINRAAVDMLWRDIASGAASDNDIIAWGRRLSELVRDKLLDPPDKRMPSVDFRGKIALAILGLERRNDPSWQIDQDIKILVETPSEFGTSAPSRNELLKDLISRGHFSNLDRRTAGQRLDRRLIKLGLTLPTRIRK